MMKKGGRPKGKQPVTRVSVRYNPRISLRIKKFLASKGIRANSEGELIKQCYLFVAALAPGSEETLAEIRKKQALTYERQLLDRADEQEKVKVEIEQGLEVAQSVEAINAQIQDEKTLQKLVRQAEAQKESKLDLSRFYPGAPREKK